MFGLGLPEILLILLAAGILMFGSKKMVDIARSTGRLSGEFKKGRMEMERELEALAQDVNADEATEKKSGSRTKSTKT